MTENVFYLSQHFNSH